MGPPLCSALIGTRYPLGHNLQYVTRSVLDDGISGSARGKSGHAERGLSALSAVAQFHYERPNMALGGITPMQKLALAA